MRKLWVLLFLVLLWPAQARATEAKDWLENVFHCSWSPCYIHDNKGGIIGRYLNAVPQAKERHMSFVIDGECSSSCAMAMSKLRDQVCLTKTALIGIHMGFTKQVFTPDGVEVIANLTTGEHVKEFEHPPAGYRETGVHVDLDYGEDILSWAHQHGKMPEGDQVYVLTREEAMLFWKPCE